MSIVSASILIENIITKAISIARSKIGTIEKPNNRGPGIDEIFEFYNLKPGLPYCTIFVQYCYDKALTSLGLNRIFTGIMSSQTFYNSMRLLSATYTIPELARVGDIVIWRKLKLWQGHAGIIEKVDLNSKNIYTIEGNTSSNYTGNQTEGDGIWNKIRGIKKVDFDVDAFYIRGFIDMRKVLLKLVKEI